MYWTLMMSPLVRRIVMILAAVTALVGSGMYIHHSGYKSGYAEAEAIGISNMNSYREEQRRQLDALYKKQRQIEDELQTKLTQSIVEKENEIKAINDAHDRIVRGLRERPTRRDSAPVIVETPVITTSECTRTGSTGQELSREDGEFLVGEAASADTLRQALKQCREAYQRLIDRQLE